MANFNELMEELAESLAAPLYPDMNNVVTMLVEERVKMQMETDRSDEFLLIGAYIGELPPGKFREHILFDALKANYRTNENPGILSYVGKHNSLMVWRKFSLETLSVDSLIEHIKHLSGRAKKWQDAMDSGHASPDDELPQVKDSKPKNNMFGM